MTELDILNRPEYIHVALNYLPIYGTTLGALALAISLILRSRAAQLAVVTLAVTVVCTGVGAYIVQQGYRIRHSEFRPSETLTPRSEKP